MPLAEALAAYAFGVTLWLGIPASSKAYELVNQKLINDPAWKAGPKLALETVLADIAYTNRLAKELVYKGHRIRFSITWHGYPGAFLRVLSISRRLALRFGEIRVHCELIPEGMASPVTPLPSRFSVRKPSSRARAPRGSGHTRYAANLLQFYSVLKPAIEQVTVDKDYAAQLSSELFSPTGSACLERRIRFARSESTRADRVCCICMDDTVEVSTECGHAFCQECHDHWRQVNDHCPLCRADLPPPDADGFDTFVLLGSDWSKLQITPRAPPAPGAAPGNDPGNAGIDENSIQLTSVPNSAPSSEAPSSGNAVASDQPAGHASTAASAAAGTEPAAPSSPAASRTAPGEGGAPADESTASVNGNAPPEKAPADGHPPGDAPPEEAPAGRHPREDALYSVPPRITPPGEDPLLAPLGSDGTSTSSPASSLASSPGRLSRKGLRVRIDAAVTERRISDVSEGGAEEGEVAGVSGGSARAPGPLTIVSPRHPDASTPGATTPRTPGGKLAIPTSAYTLDRLVDYIFALPVSSN